jgi:hypothetical protein
VRAYKARSIGFIEAYLRDLKDRVGPLHPLYLAHVGRFDQILAHADAGDAEFEALCF